MVKSFFRFLCSIFYLVIILNQLECASAVSSLDYLIPKKIKDDAFYSAIYRYSQSKDIHNILEIGSSIRKGSTQAFIEGIKKNYNNVTLFCLELSEIKFLSLRNYYKYNPSVVCYHGSSVPISSFPREEEIISFMRTFQTSLRGFTEEEVIGWLKQDIDYIRDTNAPEHGIEQIKLENNIDFFDIVLIDGSEFTGEAEFSLIYGAKFILLNDIRTFKNYHNYMRLLSDPLYLLIEENLSLRNGYAIFQKNQN